MALDGEGGNAEAPQGGGVNSCGKSACWRHPQPASRGRALLVLTNHLPPGRLSGRAARPAMVTAGCRCVGIRTETRWIRAVRSAELVAPSQPSDRFAEPAPWRGPGPDTRRPRKVAMEDTNMDGSNGLGPSRQPMRCSERLAVRHLPHRQAPNTRCTSRHPGPLSTGGDPAPRPPLWGVADETHGAFGKGRHSLTTTKGSQAPRPVQSRPTIKRTAH